MATDQRSVLVPLRFRKPFPTLDKTVIFFRNSFTVYSDRSIINLSIICAIILCSSGDRSQSDHFIDFRISQFSGRMPEYTFKGSPRPARSEQDTQAYSEAVHEVTGIFQIRRLRYGSRRDIAGSFKVVEESSGIRHQLRKKMQNAQTAN